LAKKEIDKVMSTSKAQSIVSSRASSKAGTPRKGSFDEMEQDEKLVPRSKDGKIINKVIANE